MNEFNFKELYSATLKSTYPMEINGYTFKQNETVAAFDKIQLANLTEIKNTVIARGGYHNDALVTWQTTKELHFSLHQGVFSKIQLALMTNNKLIYNPNNQVFITMREVKSVDELSQIELKYTPQEPIFIYNNENGTLIPSDNYIITDNFITFINLPLLKEVLVDYQYNYNSKPTSTLMVGQKLLQGYLQFEGRTRVKDDFDGKIKTGIFKIPRLKLMSDLSIHLGENANPLIGRLDCIGYPVGERGKEYVMEMTLLDDDIDSDI